MSKVTVKQLLDAGFVTNKIFGISIDKWANAINVFRNSEDKYLVVHFEINKFSLSSEEPEGHYLTEEDINYLFFRK